MDLKDLVTLALFSNDTLQRDNGVPDTCPGTPPYSPALDASRSSCEPKRAVSRKDKICNKHTSTTQPAGLGARGPRTDPAAHKQPTVLGGPEPGWKLPGSAPSTTHGQHGG